MIYPTTTKQGSAQWVLDWTAQGTGPYEVWLDGDLIDVVLAGEYTYTYAGLNTQTLDDSYKDTAPPIEIFDTNESGTALSYQYPAYVFLQWHRVEDASYYSVEEYSGGSWSEVTQMPHLDTIGYYQHHSDTRADKNAGQFRVSAYDAKAKTRTPVEFDFVIRTMPSTPSWTIAWNAGTGKVEAS